MSNLTSYFVRYERIKNAMDKIDKMHPAFAENMGELSIECGESNLKLALEQLNNLYLHYACLEKHAEWCRNDIGSMSCEIEKRLEEFK